MNSSRTTAATSLTSTPRPGGSRTDTFTPRSTGGSPVPKLHLSPNRSSKIGATPRTPNASAAAAASPNRRSASMASNASAMAAGNPSSSTSRFSGKAGVNKSARQRADDARKKFEQELERHLNGLLHTKQRLRRAHDDVGKEFSGLTSTLRAARDVMGDLEGLKKVDLSGTSDSVRMMEATHMAASGSNPSSAANSQPASARGTRKPEALTPRSSAVPFASGSGSFPTTPDVSNEALLPPQTPTTAYNRFCMPEVASAHTTVLERNHAIMERVLADGQEVLNQLNLIDRKAQHLMQLADRAAEVDLQCMSGGSVDNVLVNGSPMFPSLTIDDADAVVEEAASECSRAGRFSQYVRRLMTSGLSEVSHSVEEVNLAVKNASRVAVERVATLQRELESMVWAERRLQKQHHGFTIESQEVLDRLKYIHHTLQVRNAAQSAFGGGPATISDPVSNALKEEEHGLEARLDELEAKLRSTENEIAEKKDQRVQKRIELDAAKAVVDRATSQKAATAPESPEAKSKALRRAAAELSLRKSPQRDAITSPASAGSKSRAGVSPVPRGSLGGVPSATPDRFQLGDWRR